eukprot:scaffold12271_cov66-Phaeocystis_antarctica.AAC.3
MAVPRAPGAVWVPFGLKYKMCGQSVAPGYTCKWEQRLWALCKEPGKLPKWAPQPKAQSKGQSFRAACCRGTTLPCALLRARRGSSQEAARPRG